MPIVPNVGPGAPQLTAAATVRDFTGGLNYTVDTFKLAQNESPDMMNVDVSRRGGVARRRAWQEVAAIGQTKGFGRADDSTVRHMVFQQEDGTLWFWSGGTPVQCIRNDGVDTGTTSTCVDLAVVVLDTDWNADEMNWAVFGGLAYGTRGYQAGPEPTISYDPSGVAAKTDSSIKAMTDPVITTWQDDYDSPSGVHMPISRYVASHQGAFWVAHTWENGAEYANRIRWSHPGDAGSWRTDDWIDVGLDDNDRITGLCPHQDKLLVFKKHSVYAVIGYSPDTFTVVKISDTNGVVGQRAITCNEMGAWFFDEHDGLMVYTGQQVQWMFGKIHDALLGRDIQQVEKVTVASLGRRIWVNCRWNGLVDEGRVFVFDMDVGAWTAYSGFTKEGIAGPDCHIRHAFEYSQDGVTSKFYGELAFTEGTAKSALCEVDIYQNWVDNFPSGPVNKSCKAWYKSPWYDMGKPEQPKRWKRPSFVLGGGAAQTTLAKIYTDWNASDSVGTLTMDTQAVAGSTLWGTQNWGAFSWSQYSTLTEEIVTDGNISKTGHSVQFEFIAPEGAEWELDAIMLKWRDKRIKG